MNGLMTEREWRKQYCRKQRRPEWWGAQYVVKQRTDHPLQHDRAFRWFLFLLSMTFSVLLPWFVPRSQIIPSALPAAAELVDSVRPRQISTIHYAPYSGPVKEYIFTFNEIAGGRMLLLDAEHPHPKDAPPPNTFSIASYGHGMIPVSSLHIRSGRETIEALQGLFHALREKGVQNLQVCGGTVSRAQQLEEQLSQLRSRMKRMPIQKALADVLSRAEWPGTGEMLGEHTVEIRLHSKESTGTVRNNAEETLLQIAWRHGFICTQQGGADGKPYRLRYVGKAHATAMTFLDLDLESYLHFLHQTGSLTIEEHGEPKYLIMSKALRGTRVAFDLPVNAHWDASLDNLGYAVVACTL